MEKKFQKLFIEMYENIKQNKILYSIIEQFNNNFDENL